MPPFVIEEGYRGTAAAPVGFKRDAAVEPSDPNIFYDKRGKLRGMEREARDVTIKGHPGVQQGNLADEIRDQLLVRREAGRAMAPEFRRMRNDANAAREARAIANSKTVDCVVSLQMKILATLQRFATSEWPALPVMAY